MKQETIKILKMFSSNDNLKPNEADYMYSNIEQAIAELIKEAEKPKVFEEVLLVQANGNKVPSVIDKRTCMIAVGWASEEYIKLKGGRIEPVERNEKNGNSKC